MWKLLSWSLVSVQFQAPLLLISGVSSSPVQWVTLIKGWGSSRHVSWLSAFSVVCPDECSLTSWWQRGSGLKAGSSEGAGGRMVRLLCFATKKQLKHSGKSVACDWLGKWRSVPVKAEILAGAYAFFSSDPSWNFGPNANYKPDFLLSELATILIFQYCFSLRLFMQVSWVNYLK